MTQSREIGVSTESFSGQLMRIGPHKGTCTATFCHAIWRFVPWGLLFVEHAHLLVNECFLWELLGCRTAEYAMELPLW